MYRKKSVNNWSSGVELSGRWRLVIWGQIPARARPGGDLIA